MNQAGRFGARTAPRFHIELPVELENGVGVTRDFCTTGVFFTCERGFAPGSQISFTIVLDGQHVDKPLRLQCSGEVVRIEAHGESVGVAAKINEYTIQN